MAAETGVTVRFRRWWKACNGSRDWSHCAVQEVEESL